MDKDVKTDLEIELESKLADLESNLAKITKERDEFNAKISELQSFICKRLTTEDIKNPDGSKDFKTLYLEAIKENSKKKE